MSPFSSRPPLFLALALVRPRAQILLYAGAYASPMEVDGDKLTPLDYALSAEGGAASQTEVVELLLQGGALSIHTLRELAVTALQTWWRRVLARRREASRHDSNSVAAIAAEAAASRARRAKRLSRLSDTGDIGCVSSDVL